MVDNIMKFKDKSLKEKIINILLDILIVLFSIVLVVSIYNTIQIKIFKNNYSNFFGYSVFEVQTNSMSDYINSNDWIIVKITDNIKLNDVVTYNENGEYITHRVIEKYNGTYVTQGDANNAKDDPIDQKQIVGKVVKVLPNFGILRKTIFNKEVLFVLILTLLVINMMYKKKKINVKEIVADSTEENLNSNNNTDLEVNNKIKDDILDKLEDSIDKINIDPSKVDVNLFVNKRMEEESNKIEESIKLENEMDTSFLDDDKKNSILGINKDEKSNDTIISVDTTSLEQEKVETEENEKIIEENEQLLAEKKAEKEKILAEKEAEKERIKALKEASNEPEQLTQITLEKLQAKRKNKKSKNIIEKIMFVKSEQLNEFLSLLDNEELQVNEFTIKNELIKAYINAKFYNECDNDSDTDGVKKITKYVFDVGDILISEYKGQDTKYNEKVEKYKKIFNLIINLECTDFEYMEQAERNRFYKRIITEYADGKNWDINKVEEIEEKFKLIQKKYIGVIEFLMKNLDTKIFTLKMNQLKSKKRMYGLELEHNIQFDKIYSDEVIDDTYKKGIIAEDKMIVLLNLLLIQLIKDMILTNFNKKYILYLPKTIYTKKNKFDNILKMVDDKYAKDNILFLTEYDNLVKNKEIIKKCKQNGYQFTLIFNEDLKSKVGFKNNVYLVDYIFIDKDNIKETDYNELIPDDIKNRVIYEDMTGKVGDLEEEGEN